MLEFEINAIGRRVHGVVRPAGRRKERGAMSDTTETTPEITEEIIETIVFTLHDKMQFYDASGQLANGKILAEAEKVLKEHFLDSE